MPLRWIVRCWLVVTLLVVPGGAPVLAQEDDPRTEEAAIELLPEAPAAGPVDVALDPGHSRADVGAAGGGLAEYELTLELARQVAALLAAEGLSVRLTRSDHEPASPMADPDPIERTRIEQEARIARAGQARVYLSIHLNAHRRRSLRGVETYYNPDNQGDESYRLAAAVQRQVVAALAAVGYEPVDRGVRSDLLAGKPYGHFFSLRGPFPSALIEAGFLSNPQEAAALGRGEVRQAIAAGIAAGLVDYQHADAGAPGGAAPAPIELVEASP